MPSYYLNPILKYKKIVLLSLLLYIIPTTISLAQKIMIAPKVGWYGLVRFSSQENEDLKLFQAPQIGLDFYLQLNQYLSLRLSNEYLIGISRSFPESSVTYTSRGFSIIPSLMINGRIGKKIAPIMSIGLLTSIPELVLNFKGDKSIYTGTVSTGISSSLGGKYKINEKISFLTELLYTKTKYRPSKLVSRLEESIAIEDFKQDSRPKFDIEGINISFSLLFEL